MVKEQIFAFWRQAGRWCRQVGCACHHAFPLLDRGTCLASAATPSFSVPGRDCLSVLPPALCVTLSPSSLRLPATTFPYLPQPFPCKNTARLPVDLTCSCDLLWLVGQGQWDKTWTWPATFCRFFAAASLGRAGRHYPACCARARFCLPAMRCAHAARCARLLCRRAWRAILHARALRPRACLRARRACKTPATATHSYHAQQFCLPILSPRSVTCLQQCWFFTANSSSTGFLLSDFVPVRLVGFYT